MVIGQFKWWQGCIAGAIIGLALWLLLRPPADGWQLPTTNGLTTRRFTQLAELGDQPDPDGRRMTGVRVHPAKDGIHRVTGWVVGGELPDAAFEMLTPVPFVIQGKRTRAGRIPDRSFDSVRAYLGTAAPALRYRYAWWEHVTTGNPVTFGGPILALGVVLPLTFQLLIRAGLIAKLEPAPVLPAFDFAKPEAAPTAPPIDHDAVAAELALLTGQLEQQLADGAFDPDSDASAVGTPTAAPPATATFAPTAAPIPEPSVPLETKDPTSFEGGEFYPVHRPKRAED